MITLEQLERGYEEWANKPHNAKWVKRLEGTPIANDIVVSIFNYLSALALSKSQAVLDAVNSEASDLVEIVEGVKCSFDHGVWRDRNGFRLKDTREWCRFYSAVKALAIPLPAGVEPEPIFVPAGWQLVPKEPTFQMASAAIHLDPKSDLDAKYRAMLTAAPIYAPAYSEIDDDAFTCIACSKVIQEGELVFHEYGEGGLIHAECLGSDRESYCSDDGEPLGPDDPLPKPFPYVHAEYFPSRCGLEQAARFHDKEADHYEAHHGDKDGIPFPTVAAWHRAYAQRIRALSSQQVEDSKDLVLVPRDLIGAACSAIDKKRDAPKTLAALRRHAKGV